MSKKVHPCSNINATNLLKRNADTQNCRQNQQDGTQRKFREILQEILEENNKAGNK